MSKKERFIKYLISSLAIGMIMILWAFCMDAFLYGTWRFFGVVLSIMLYAFVFCLLQGFISYYLENRPLLSILAEYITVVLLFFAFGIKFGWYPGGKEWLALIYTIPVYAVCYALRLVGISREADYINKRLKERKQHKPAR